MSGAEWVQYWQTRDPEELMDYRDTRLIEELREKGIVARIVSAYKRRTRKGEEMWEMRDSVNYRHYLFRDKFQPESDLFAEWYTHDLLERLDTMTMGSTIQFNPPIHMYVMKHKSGFSHVWCPAGDKPGG